MESSAIVIITRETVVALKTYEKNKFLKQLGDFSGNLCKVVLSQEMFFLSQEISNNASSVVFTEGDVWSEVCEKMTIYCHI